MPSSLSKRKREWDDVASVDPYWGVLTHPQAKHGAWDQSAFLASGEQQIAALLSVARGFAVPEHRGTALDFGCGLGRLTRALSTRFDHVYGVDASGALIEQAQDLNRDLNNSEFRQLHDDGLAAFRSNSIDLVCSLLVLQHQARESTIAAYITEFIRVLRPGGVAIFQIPTHIPIRNRLQARRHLYSTLRLLGLAPSVLYTRLRLDPLRMRHMPRTSVLVAIERAGGRLLTALDDDLAGAFPSATYYVVPDPDG